MTNYNSSVDNPTVVAVAEATQTGIFQIPSRLKGPFFPITPCSPQLPPAHIKPIDFAFLPGVTYKLQNWRCLWNAKPLNLQKYGVTVQEEVDFEAIPFRVSLEQTVDLPNFKQGQVIELDDSNSRQFRYMIEYCQRVEDDKAYIKVVCRIYNQGILPSQHPMYPSYILVIPACTCYVPLAPHIEWLLSLRN